MRDDAYAKLVHVLSRIDYLCGIPNEMEVSGYDVHCNEDAVLQAVQRLRDERDALRARLTEIAKQATEAVIKWQRKR